MRRLIRFVPVVVLLIGILTWWKIFHAGSPVGHWMHGYDIEADGTYTWGDFHHFVYDGPVKGVTEQGALFVVGPRYVESKNDAGTVLGRTYFRVSGDTLFIYDMIYNNWRDNLTRCRVYRRLK
jgi:hypothetical protein